MAPERETAQSETQTATQISQHTGIGGSCITTPMQSVTLRTSPCGACPDDALARMRALYGFPQGFIVAQGIEVMLIQSSLATMVEAIIGRCLTKVALDGRDTLLHQALYLRLIPCYGGRIREVEDGILVRHTSCSIHHMQAFLDDLGEEAVLWCEVR